MALAAYWQTYHYRSRDYETNSSKVIASCTISCFPSAINGGNTPLYFEAPAPLTAAQGRRVELELVWQAFESLRSSRDWVLVETLGGLGSPVSENSLADLAAEWRLPTVLVVPVNLGAIAQAVANVALARLSRVHLKALCLTVSNLVQSKKLPTGHQLN